MKTAKQVWDKSVEIAAHSTGIDEFWILAKDRKAPIAIARHLARWIASRCFNVPIKDIAFASGANYGTIVNSLKEISNLTETRPEMTTMLKIIASRHMNDSEFAWVKSPNQVINCNGHSEISKRLKRVIDANNLTVLELAAKSGLSQASLRKAIRRGSFNSDSLVRLCKVLNCSSDFLLFGKSNHRRKKWNSSLDIAQVA
jgi:DNA-binding Xre family transcriptional regulator